MNLDIVLSLKNVQSADAEARHTQAVRIIAELVLKNYSLEERSNDHSEIPKSQKVKAILI